MNNPFGIDEGDQLGIDLADAEADLIEQLIAMRKARGLNKSDVARQIGIHPSVVTRFEDTINGAQRPNLATIRRYAEAVNAFVGYLVVPGDEYTELQTYVKNNLEQLKCDSPVTDRSIRLVTEQLQATLSGPELRTTTTDWGTRRELPRKSLTYSGKSTS